MAAIKAFCGIRPKPELAEHIAALPYDVYNREEACEEVRKEPLSFLRIDRGETQFSDDVSPYDDCVYEKAKELLWDMIEGGDFLTDLKPCYYIYELTMETQVQTGLVACVSIDDYENRIVKEHEKTREEKEQDRIRHIDTCNAQTGPVFLAYRANQTINQVINNKKEDLPVYDFHSKDGIGHRVWLIDHPELVQKIGELFSEIQQIYIADGHHRAASAVKVGKKRRAQYPDYTGAEEFNSVLSVLFPDDQLKILSYHRVIRDLNGYSKTAFLKKLEKCFYVGNPQNTPIEPEEPGSFGMYLEDAWYLLKTKEPCQGKFPVEHLDVAVLQTQVIDKILGIQNPRTNERIDFVGGIRGIKELERRVRTDCKVAFSVFPVSMQELFAVADAGCLMPPKSTWFEPKLRSGLFIHSI